MGQLFETLRVQEFLSHHDSTIQLANRGLVLVSGEVVGNSAASSNGSGKSSLIPDGLIYALFGTTLRGASGPKVIRRDAGRDCLVTLSGFDRHGMAYKIERPQKHRTISKPRLTIGTDVYQGEKEIDEKIRLLLGGVGFDAFVSAVVFGKGDTKFFTQLTDSKRKEVLDELMAFGDLNRFLEQAKLGVVGYDQQAAEELRALQSVEARIEGLERIRADLQARAAVFAARQATRLASCEASIATLDVKLQHAIGLSQSQVPRLAQAQQTALAAAEEVTGAEASIPEIREALAKVTTAMGKHLVTQEVAQRQIKRLLEQEERAATLTGGECPTCQQQVGSKHTAKIIEGIELAGAVHVDDLATAKAFLKKMIATKATLTEGERAAEQKVQTARAARDLADRAVRDVERVIHETKN